MNDTLCFATMNYWIVIAWLGGAMFGFATGLQLSGIVSLGPLDATIAELRGLLEEADVFVEIVHFEGGIPEKDRIAAGDLSARIFAALNAGEKP